MRTNSTLQTSEMSEKPALIEETAEVLANPDGYLEKISTLMSGISQEAPDIPEDIAQDMAILGTPAVDVISDLHDNLTTGHDKKGKKAQLTVRLPHSPKNVAKWTEEVTPSTPRPIPPPASPPISLSKGSYEFTGAEEEEYAETEIGSVHTEMSLLRKYIESQVFDLASRITGIESRLSLLENPRAVSLGHRPAPSLTEAPADSVKGEKLKLQTTVKEPKHGVVKMEELPYNPLLIIQNRHLTRYAEINGLKFTPMSKALKKDMWVSDVIREVFT